MGMQDTATKFKIPRYCLYTCAARSLSMIWHATNWVAQGLIPMPLDAAKPLQIPGFPPLSPIDLPEVYLQGNEMKFPPQRLVDAAKKLKEATGVLVNTVNELESGVITGIQKILQSDSEQEQVGSLTYHGVSC
jgi:hypothetical protein